MSFRLSKKAAAAFLKGGGRAPIEPEKRAKFGNRKVELDGVRFDSAGEVKRWSTLKLMVLAREITKLERQVRYPLAVNGVLITTYIADFTYVVGTRIVVEDFKGFLTPEAKLKLKLMRAIYGIDVLLTRAKN